MQDFYLCSILQCVISTFTKVEDINTSSTPGKIMSDQAES